MVSATNAGHRELSRRPVMAFLSGNLCYQIEHHLFPDLPSNRYAEIGQRVRAVCATDDLPYTTGPLGRQYLLTFRTISKLTLPDRLMTPTPDDAPETASENKFRNVNAPYTSGDGNGDTRRRGLVTAIRNRQNSAPIKEVRAPRWRCASRSRLPLLPGHVVGHLMMRSPQMVCWPTSWVPLERRPSGVGNFERVSAAPFQGPPSAFRSRHRPLTSSPVRGCRNERPRRCRLRCANDGLAKCISVSCRRRPGRTLAGHRSNSLPQRRGFDGRGASLRRR